MILSAGIPMRLSHPDPSIAAGDAGAGDALSDGDVRAIAPLIQSLDRLGCRERIDGGAARTGEMGGKEKNAPGGPRKPLKRLDSDKEIKVNCGQNPSPFPAIPRILQGNQCRSKPFQEMCNTSPHRGRLTKRVRCRPAMRVWVLISESRLNHRSQAIGAGRGALTVSAIRLTPAFRETFLCLFPLQKLGTLIGSFYRWMKGALTAPDLKAAASASQSAQPKG